MGAFASIVRFCAGFVVMALASVLAVLAALPLLPWRVARIKLCNLYGKVVGRSIVFLVGATPRVSAGERLDPARPAIYVANHTSALDIFLCGWLCPYGGCGVMKKEVARIPMLGQFALLSGNPLIDRARTEKAVEKLRGVADFVRAHRLGIWIMPEGTRSLNGRLQPFKKGFVHLAIATGYPVVPVVLHGVHRSWRMGSLRLQPTDVDVEVLPPIDTSAWSEATAGSHADEVHAVFARALRDDQKPLEVQAAQRAA